MNEKLKIENQKAKTQKFIGKTTIELRDAETGELTHIHEDKNMVTGFFQALHDQSIGTYSWQPTNIAQMIKGVQLISNEEAEDESNVYRDVTNSKLTGFGNLAVNATQTNTKWMSLNLLETGKTDTGYKWVWDANPNQCNGHIQCLNLIACDLTKTHSTYNAPSVGQTFMFALQSYPSTGDQFIYPKYVGKLVDETGNEGFTDLQSGTFSNPVHIDWENDILYDIEYDSGNDKVFKILRYDMRRNEIGVKYGGIRFKLIDERSVTLNNSLNLMIDTDYSRPYSAKVIGNTLYLVRGGATTFAATSNLLRIIKVNLEDLTFTDTMHTLTQSFNAYRKYKMDFRKNTYKMHFVKDFYPIDKDANIYLWQNIRDLVRVNLNDISDIEQIEFGGLSTHPNATVSTTQQDFNIVTDKYIYFGNYADNTSTAYSSNVNMGLGIALRLDDHKCGIVSWDGITNKKYVNRADGLYSSGSSGFSVYGTMMFVDAYNGVLTYFNVLSATTSSGAGGPSDNVKSDGLIYVEQSWMDQIQLTINNVAPVVKTSDKTMRVIYEITEAD